MATYVETNRTNYFRVTDEEAFRAWVAKRNLYLMDRPGGAGVANMFAVSDACGTFYRQAHEDSEDLLDDAVEEPEDIFLLEELATFLAPGEVAVLMQVGYENLRYTVGVATAINSEGNTVRIDLDAIYDLAKCLGTNITPAEY